MFSKIFPKIHAEGYKFLVISGIITIVFYSFSNFFGLLISKGLGLILIILTIWVYYFFRDPERFSINNDNYLVSPADGVISQIIETNGPAELGLDVKKFTRVSIFMNVFNCHVNRSPVSGKVTQIFYKAGKFLNASLDKASEDNERNYIRLNNANGEDVVLVQIAGLIARRIVCDVNEKDEIKQGERFGIIRFGSRVDLYFENYELLVQKNQISVSGETLIAKKR